MSGSESEDEFQSADEGEEDDYGLFPTEEPQFPVPSESEQIDEITVLTEKVRNDENTVEQSEKIAVDIREDDAKETVTMRINSSDQQPESKVVQDAVNESYSKAIHGSVETTTPDDHKRDDTASSINVEDASNFIEPIIEVSSPNEDVDSEQTVDTSSQHNDVAHGINKQVLANEEQGYIDIDSAETLTDEDIVDANEPDYKLTENKDMIPDALVEQGEPPDSTKEFKENHYHESEERFQGEEENDIVTNDISNAKPHPLVDTNENNSISANENDTDAPDGMEGDWGWDSWADDFITNTANKVSSLLETVEGQLGIPDPGELAKLASNQDKEEDNRDLLTSKPEEHTVTQQSAASSWYSSLVTNFVQNTGTELLSGSIGALEFIGKKTVDILSDGDPGLRSKREALLGKNKPNLSEVLQEARIKNCDKSTNATKSHNPKEFNDMLEKFQGIPNLDALEMLSNECQTKLKRILNVQSNAARDESAEVLQGLSANFELKESNVYEEEREKGDFKKALFSFTKKLQLKVTCSKLLNTWSKLKEKSSNISLTNESECYEATISALAEITSRCIEYYRKIADMLMLTDMQAKDLARDRALALRKITELFQCEVGLITNDYANYLAEQYGKTESTLLTDIYLEGSNCSTFLEDSHQLLLPILQLSAIK